MSLQPRRLPEVPADTARAAVAAFARGSLAIRIRDELGEVWSDERFRGLFGVRGKPGISPAQLMIVLVLAMVGNLTDRQAADMVRRAIDWKYALGLSLEDPGFDFTVLSEFRARLVAGSMETEALDVLLATVISDSWAGVYGSRIDDLHLPESQTKRTALAVAYGSDDYRLLGAVYATGAPPWLAELPAVETLRRIWVQQYYRVIDGDREKVIRREATEQGLPPGRLTLVSPYDLDARSSEKRGKGWTGYKAHFTETCATPADEDPDTGRPTAPNLITHVATTQATVTDVAMTEPIHDSLHSKNLLPDEHIVDAGYTSAELLLSARAPGLTLLGPLLTDTSPQARGGGYTTAAFTIDWQARHAHCPQGVTSTSAGARAPSAAPRRSWSSSMPPPARLPRPRAHAPAPPDRDANYPCAPALSTRPSNKPAPSRPPTSGTTTTRSGPGLRAPCARPPTSPASATPATWACPRPPWNTPSPPQPSTSSATTPSSPEDPRPDPNHTPTTALLPRRMTSN
jgi:transposase